MPANETLLYATMVAAALLLALTVVAFAFDAKRLGTALLVLSAATTVAAYPTLGAVAADGQDRTRAAIEAKYGIDVTAWPSPLGSAQTWEIDGKERDCELDLSDEDDPVLTCTGPELTPTVP